MNGSPMSWPDDEYREAAFAVGSTCALLLADASWVHRRVETVDLLSTELVRRSTSIDFTVPAPSRSMLRVSDRAAVVPIATLAKQPLRNFDLRDEGGRTVPVLGRGHNGEIAHNALLGAAGFAAHQADRPSLTPRTVADLRAIAIGDQSEAAATTGAMVRAAEEGDPELETLLDDGWTFFLLSLLASNYILLAVLADIDSRRILKFAYDEALEDSRSAWQRLSQGLGAAELTFNVDVPGAVRATSYHAEIVIPQELRITDAVLYDVDDLTIYGSDTDADRGAVYASDLEPSARTALFVELRAERAGLPTIALAVGAVTASLLILGAIVFEPDPQTAGPPVSVLLAASALFAGAVAQRGEHNLVQRLFSPLRAVLFGTGIAALAAAATLAFNASDDTIDLAWKISAAATTALGSMLAYAYGRAVPMTKATADE
jgi:hypothetical protein